MIRRFLIIAVLFLLATGCAANNVNSTYWRDHYPDKKYVRLGVIDTHYEVTGTGPPLILLHGFGYGYEMFFRNIPELSKHFTVYALDLRGGGFSSKPDGFDYSMQLQMQHVLEFMEHFQIEKANIWGHSLGGTLALLMAIYLPERVDHLIVSDPPVYERDFPSPLLKAITLPVIGKFIEWFPTKYGAKKIMEEVYYDHSLITPEYLDRVTKLLKTPGTSHAAREILRNIRFEDAEYFESLYGKIQAPTLILWGREDRWFPPKNGERLHEEIKGSQFKVFPKAGHVVIEEGGADLNAAIVSFIENGQIENGVPPE